jgi:hypothetical protein
MSLTPGNRTGPHEGGRHVTPGDGHDAGAVNAPVPGMGDEGMPEVVKGGVGHAGFAARPLKRMRNTRGMVTRVHLLRVRLPGIHQRRVDEHPWTAHVSCSSFERACQCLVQGGERHHTTPPPGLAGIDFP